MVTNVYPDVIKANRTYGESRTYFVGVISNSAVFLLFAIIFCWCFRQTTQYQSCRGGCIQLTPKTWKYMLKIAQFNSYSENA